MADRAVSFTFTTKDQQALASLKRLEKGFRDLDVQVDRTKSSGLNLAGSLGRLAIGAGVAMAVQEFDEAEKVANKTAAAIEATGGAAGKTADEIAALADELGKMAAVDNDVVQNAANVLLTFKQIQGTNFDAALASTLDLSAAFGTDLQSAAMQVGKALNDPLKGLTALRRAGVDFTAQQREQITAMVETGRVADAQRLILAELESQVGGAAEANATSLDRIRVSIGAAAESLGGALAPAVEVAAGALGGMAEVLDGLPAPLQTAAIGAIGAAAAWNRWGDSLDGVGGKLRTNVSDLSRMDIAITGAAAGVTAFTGTLALLESQAKFGGDVDDLSRDLRAFGEGSATAAEGVAELGGGVDDLVETFKRGTDVSAAEALWGTFGVGGTRIQDIRKAQDEIRALDEALAGLLKAGDTEAARAAYAAYSAELLAAGFTAEQIATAFSNYNDELERTERSTAGADGATKAWFESYDGQTEKIQARTDALARSNDETERAQDLALAAASREFAYLDAVDGTKQAQEALAEARAKGDPAEIARAERDLAEAILRQSGAALENARAQAEAEGRTLDAAEANAILQAEMEAARQTTGYWNDTLQTTVDRLAYVTAGHTVRVNTDDAEANLVRLNELAQLLEARLRNLAGASLGRAQLGPQDTMGGSLAPANSPGPTPGANGQGTIGSYPNRSLTVNLNAPNLTRLGSPSEVANAFDGAGRAMSRRLSQGG